MEKLSMIAMKKFKDTAERILHVPGNYRGGILEMAVVVDTCMQKETLQWILPQLLRGLKQQGQIFRNVRFNYLLWNGFENGFKIETKICPMMQAMQESFYEKYEQEKPHEKFQEKSHKDMHNLIQHLKLFQARAKLIILLTDSTFTFWQSEELKKQMQPFLDKKLMLVQIKEEQIAVFYREREV